MIKVRKKLIREKAVIAMYQYLLTSATLEEINAFLTENYKPRMDDQEVELCRSVVVETIENQEDIGASISKCLKKGWTLDRLSKMEQAILFIAVHDIAATPKEIVVNEAVELAKKYCDEDSYKFINGVLSQIG